MILILPGFLYYLLTVKGKNRYHPLPIYGAKVVAKTTHRKGNKNVPDTIYHQLGDFHLTDQNGKPVSLKSMDDKIFVVDFFYTHCPDVCSTINGYMDSLAIGYAKNNLVYFASITVDPKRDSAKALNNYSKQYHIPASKWQFLTGDTATVYRLARQGFLVNALDEGNGNFIYSDKIILIDSHKRIRGYYSGTSLTDVTLLNDEIKVLISEELLTKEAPLY
ncbi:MAG: SCO family protein [Sphingobacteriales bacterium]